MKRFAACVVLAVSPLLAQAQPAPSAPAAPDTAPATISPTAPAPAPSTPATPTAGTTPTAAGAATSTAQQKLDDWDAKTSDYDKLKTPDSPAFVILGVSPTEIQRPTTPKGVSTTLGGFVSGASVTIPRSLALEVAPFWLFAHPDLDMRHYRDERWQRLYRTLSISLGTAQVNRTTMDAAGMTTAHVDADVGIGARTIIFQGGAAKDDACTRQANAYGQELAAAVVLSGSERAVIEQAHAFGTPGYDTAIAQALQAKADQVANQAAKGFAAAPRCVAEAASAKGISVDVAGALDVHVADAKVTKDNASLAAKALWLNASYDGDDVAGVAMVRYASHDTAVGLQRVLDSGVRGLYKAKTFALSAEALLRYRINAGTDRSTYKVDVSVEYEVSGDTWISVVLGKDVTFTPGDAGSLFSLANVKFGMGKPKIGGT